MRLSWRKWGVSGMAWLSVLALGGMALAGVVASSEPSAWLSPEGAVTGKALSSGEPFEMTLHFQGDPDASYDLAVGYDGDGIGVCQADAASLSTNGDGKATFECDFATVENTGTEDLAGTVTFTVSREGEDVAAVVASLSVSPAEVEEEEEVEETEEATEEGEETGPNHGHCVSYWSHQAKEQGLSGKHKGAFVSSIAQNPDALADKDTPGDGCDFQAELDEALVAQAEADAAREEARAEKLAQKQAAKESRAAKAKGPKTDDDEDDTGTE